MEDSLLISDDFIFSTLEGEGRYVGWPSIFIRLSKCNLTCSAFKSPDSPFGCDSYISWSKVNKMTFDEIFKYYEDRDYIEKLRKGAIFKISGGEPLLQQKALLRFIDKFKQKYNFTPCIDFETNGTIMPDNSWDEDLGATFTTSPKLSNNGDPESKRYKPEVLKYLNEIGACFKFVVKSEEDIKEIQEKYINIGIKQENIWLMPCCGSREEQNDISPIVAELCKKYNFKFSPRLQLMIWNRALKV
jgi:7-carboxy-7-deazaguanine synthase